MFHCYFQSGEGRFNNCTSRGLVESLIECPFFFAGEINSAYKDLGKCKTPKFTSGNSAQIIALYFLRTLEFLGMFHWLTRRTILVCLSASFLSVVQTGYFLLLHLRVHQFFPLLSPSIVFLILVVAFSVPKMPFGSSLHFLFICQDFRLFIYCKCVHNCCWSIFTTAPLKFLLHNSNVGFVSVLVCVSCLFSLKLRLFGSWYAQWFFIVSWMFGPFCFETLHLISVYFSRLPQTPR